MNFIRIVMMGSMMACLTAAQTPSSSGIDRGNLDAACKPCDDFWRYANGGWLDRNPIPARYGRWGTLSVVNEGNRERLRTILESAAANVSAPSGSNERRIGDFFGSCMDLETIEKLGVQPLKRELELIASISDGKQLASALIEFQRRGGAAGFAVIGMQDLKNSREVIANVAGSGISLPDRDYYFKTDDRSKTIRDEYTKHVAKMLELLGDEPEEAAASAKMILAFETRLADAMMTNVQRRDPYARYHKMDLAGLTELTPAQDWRGVFAALNIPESTAVNVLEPEYMKRLQQQMTSVPLSDWKTWLRWRLVNSAAPTLSKAFVDESFHFSSTVLNGVKEQQPRWQTCANTVDSTMGDALGELFVKKHFPPDAKKRMLELVENLRATLREELQNAAWLDPATRTSAVAKLNSFVPKIGYPDKWRDYSQVQISPKAYFANVRSAAAVNRAYQLAKIGKPVNRNDWGMTPPTVNAYYNSVQNEIAFPAGILQPPLFDMNADDAMNYGAIGAVIGHEMGHGFDDQGSKFDAEGNLKNWWTAEDRKKFEQRAGCVIDQFNTLDVGEGLRHTGKLVVGEAMGDLGGLTLAYRAYRRTLKGKPEPPVVDGFTADQRFFLAFARVWATQDRPESMRLRLNTDPHPLGKFRANGTLMNMPEFHRAFQCQQGQPMVRPVESQCKLW